MVRIQLIRAVNQVSYTWDGVMKSMEFHWRWHAVIADMMGGCEPVDVLGRYGDGLGEFLRFIDNVIFKHLFDDVVAWEGNYRPLRNWLRRYTGGMDFSKRTPGAYAAVFVLVAVEEIDPDLLGRVKWMEEVIMQREACRSSEKSSEYVSSFDIATKHMTRDGLSVGRLGAGSSVDKRRDGAGKDVCDSVRLGGGGAAASGSRSGKQGIDYSKWDDFEDEEERFFANVRKNQERGCENFRATWQELRKFWTNDRKGIVASAFSVRDESAVLVGVVAEFVEQFLPDRARCSRILAADGLAFYKIIPGWTDDFHKRRTIGEGYISIEVQGQLDAFASRHSIRGSSASHLVDLMLLVGLLMIVLGPDFASLSGLSVSARGVFHVGSLLWGKSDQWQNLVVELWTRSSYSRRGVSFLKQQEIGWILQSHALKEVASKLNSVKHEMWKIDVCALLWKRDPSFEEYEFLKSMHEHRKGYSMVDPGSAADRVEETEVDGQASRSTRAAGVKTAITQSDLARGAALLALDAILEELVFYWSCEEDGDPISLLKNHILTEILGGFRLGRETVSFREHAFVFGQIFGCGCQSTSLINEALQLLKQAVIEHKNGGRRALLEFFQKREIRPLR